MAQDGVGSHGGRVPARAAGPPSDRLGRDADGEEAACAERDRADEQSLWRHHHRRGERHPGQSRPAAECESGSGAGWAEAGEWDL